MVLYAAGGKNSYNFINSLIGPVGLEPTTYGLEIVHITTILSNVNAYEKKVYDNQVSMFVFHKTYRFRSFFNRFRISFVSSGHFGNVDRRI